jgi:2-dehydro-3-deoxyphosphogluconate aldolase/(4S)-4-hydroxy-2-oxoglutarate aldolase
MPTDPTQRLLSSGIVGIIRAPDGGQLVDVARALLAGGIDVLEVTFTVPKAHRVLEQVADALGDKVLLGAGTVLDPETCRTAILAGAEFIVSPGTNLDVIRMCKRYSKLALPGALTPTEVITAWEAGADFVKVFPCDVLGPAHLRALRGPLPQVRMIPTGGVTLETAADFLKSGASALGIGSALVEPKAIAAGDFGRIESLAKQYVEIVRATRAAMKA